MALPAVPTCGQAAALLNGLRDRRILISANGPQAKVLKIRPPLVFSRANADRLLRLSSMCRSVMPASDQSRHAGITGRDLIRSGLRCVGVEVAALPCQHD